MRLRIANAAAAVGDIRIAANLVLTDSSRCKCVRLRLPSSWWSCLRACVHIHACICTPSTTSCACAARAPRAKAGPGLQSQANL